MEGLFGDAIEGVEGVATATDKLSNNRDLEAEKNKSPLSATNDVE